MIWPLIWLVLQEAPTDQGSILDFVQYGVLGLVVVGMILGWLWPKPSVTRMLAERDQAIADRDKTIARLIEERNQRDRERTELLDRLADNQMEMKRVLERIDKRRPR